MALTLAKIQNGAGPDKEWEPSVFHRVEPSQVGDRKHWWYQAVEGIQVLGEDRPRRTAGKPKTLERVDKNFGNYIEMAVEHVVRDKGRALYHRNVESPDLDLIARKDEFIILCAATFATENGGKLVGDRFEAHINDWSYGGAQFLTATAKAVAKKYKFNDVPAKTMRQDGSVVNQKRWKEFLEDPLTAALLMAYFHFDNNERWSLKGDPLLLYSTYNAGSPRPSKQTKFGLVYYDPDKSGPKPGATDHFSHWYGDSCKVFG